MTTITEKLFNIADQSRLVDQCYKDMKTAHHITNTNEKYKKEIKRTANFNFLEGKARNGDFKYEVIKHYHQYPDKYTCYDLQKLVNFMNKNENLPIEAKFSKSEYVSYMDVGLGIPYGTSCSVYYDWSKKN